jgi:hypothetical protein
MMVIRQPARLALAALAVAAAALVVPAAAAAAPERWTPVTATVVAPPEPVEGSDGRIHLAYELLLINRSFLPPARATVKRVDALAGGRVVASLRGRRLAAVMQRVGAGRPGARLAKGESAAVLMDVRLPRGARVPRRLEHRLAISLRPDARVSATRYRTAPTRVLRRPAVVVAPPLRGAGWVVGNGCCAALTSHRAALLPVDGALFASERFAIDFIQIAPSGLLGTGPLERLASYPFYGAEVLAAKGGRVVAVVDGLPDTPPGALPPTTAARAGGNHVVVDMGGGRWALYAHLKPGTARVRVGDRVRTGDVLGLLGSSGNSNAPHLHFHVMDGPRPLAANGLPFRFDRYVVQGTLRNFGELFLGRRARIAPQMAGEHRRRMPFDQQVIAFPD